MSLSLPESLRLLLPDGSVKRILLEDYLRGVVAAALPADAPLEAMKTLAVAARTFAANTHRHLEQHADVCTTRHCQQWNERANPRAARAVMETRGIVASFKNELIEAFYFEHCDGKTREAKGVLMGAPAYLKSVTCPCGFASMKGHGIGMCLRGMLAMARLGERYDHILEHYYSGIALQELGIDETTRATETARPERSEGSSVKREGTPTSRVGDVPLSAKPRTISHPTPVTRPTRRVEPEPPKTETPSTPVETQSEKPVRRVVGPRRSARQKIEQQAPPAPPSAPEPMPPAGEPAVTLGDAHSPEQDDLLLFLTVEDVNPTTDNRRQTTDNRPPIIQEMVEPPSAFRPPSPFAAAPPPFDAGRAARAAGLAGIRRAAPFHAGRAAPRERIGFPCAAVEFAGGCDGRATGRIFARRAQRRAQSRRVYAAHREILYPARRAADHARSDAQF